MSEVDISMQHLAKLSSAQVRVMRRLRQDGKSYAELGERFSVHVKTVQRICTGKERRDAGGPIEQLEVPKSESEHFDTVRLVRCRECGGMVHPPCFLCSRRKAKGLLERRAA